MKKKVSFFLVFMVFLAFVCIIPIKNSHSVKYANEKKESNLLSVSNSSDLKDFLESVTITDTEGKNITDNTLSVGSRYNIRIVFSEKGATGAQFTPTAEHTMTYQFPSNFKLPPVENQKFEIEIESTTVEIGTYTIDDNGLLTIYFNEAGIKALGASNDLKLEWDLQAILRPVIGSPSESVVFGNTDDDFTFQVDNNPDLSLEKIGSYNSADQLLNYQVTAKVSSGTLTDVEIEDDILPYNNESVKLELQENSVKVKLNHGGSQIELTTEDYDIEHLEDMHFKIKMKATSQYNDLFAGDELIVNYDYKAEFIESQTGTFYATVINAAEFSGNVNQPDGSKKSSSAGGSTTLYVSPAAPNDVSLVKTQKWDPTTKTLTYRIYVEVKSGSYFNFNLVDYLNVYYELKQHSLANQLIKGDVKVYATDIEEYEALNIANIDAIAAKYENQLKPLKVIHKNDLNNTSYDPKDMNSVIFDEGPTVTSYSFGYDKDKGTSSYNYGKNRFLKFEYQIDLSNGVTLFDNQQVLTFDELLKVGITNNANFRYNNYESFNEVYFAEGKDLEKKAVVNNRKNTIDYTVSIDIDDTENYYFIKRICEEFYTPFGESITFVDDYDDGFEYVEGTLKLIYKFKDGTYLTFNYVGNDETGERWRPDAYMDPDFKNGLIKANYRSFLLSKEESTHDIIASDYPENYLYNRMDIDSIDFVYTIQAKDSWLKEHADDDNDTIVKNKAMMTSVEDPTGEEFNAESEVPFFPARVLKEAKQEGTSGLIHFTLKVNPNSADLDKSSEFLTVTDTSSGIRIDFDSITVTDEAGEEIFFTIQENNENEFTITVPDSKALTIQYDASTKIAGDEISVKNSASIGNVNRASDTYDEVLYVSETSSGGGGRAYELTIYKVDSQNSKKFLPGAKFKFYLVVPPESSLEATDKILDYDVFREDDWYFETNEKGEFKIEKSMNWRLEEGNYYILVEEEAPDGYELNENPTLFYFGEEEGIDLEQYPNALLVLPNSSLTITNNILPVQKPVEPDVLDEPDEPDVPDVPDTGERDFFTYCFLEILGILLVTVAYCIFKKKKFLCKI